MADAGTDEELLDRAVRGDAAVLRELLKRYGGAAREAVEGKIDRRWRAVLDEDDVMQVAYLEAFLHIHQLTSRDSRSFVAWLSRIAQNALRDAVRGLNCEKRPNPARRVSAPGMECGDSSSHGALLEVLGATTTTPSGDAASNEVAATVESALERLPRDYRQVVRLYDLEGLSPAEVAVLLKRSVGAVHMLRARAHERLRQELGGVSKFFSHSV